MCKRVWEGEARTHPKEHLICDVCVSTLDKVVSVWELCPLCSIQLGSWCAIFASNKLWHLILLQICFLCVHVNKCYVHTFYRRVTLQLEVSGNILIKVIRNICEMSPESVHEPIHSLTYILPHANLAGDKINQFGAFASDISFGNEFLATETTFQFAAPAQE